MPGDAKDYRLHAAHCAELAVKARTPQLTATFLDLSKQWERLAADLERMQTLLQAENVDFKESA
jgi:hypothetical protein